MASRRAPSLRVMVGRLLHNECAAINQRIQKFARYENVHRNNRTGVRNVQKKWRRRTRCMQHLCTHCEIMSAHSCAKENATRNGCPLLPRAVHRWSKRGCTIWVTLNKRGRPHAHVPLTWNTEHSYYIEPGEGRRSRTHSAHSTSDINSQSGKLLYRSFR